MKEKEFNKRFVMDYAEVKFIFLLKILFLLYFISSFYCLFSESQRRGARGASTSGSRTSRLVQKTHQITSSHITQFPTHFIHFSLSYSSYFILPTQQQKAKLDKARSQAAVAPETKVQDKLADRKFYYKSSGHL